MGDSIVDWKNITKIKKIRQRYAQTNLIQVQDRQKLSPVYSPTRTSILGLGTMNGTFVTQAYMSILFYNYQKTESHAKKVC